MSLLTNLKAEVISILRQPWSIRSGYSVPTTESVKLAGGGVKLNATFLYADLARSTDLAMEFDSRIAAKVARAFLATCSRIIRIHLGQIRSFDGDRVMAIFLGNDKSSRATICGLKIKYAFDEILKPQFESKYTSLQDFDLGYGVGIDTSEVLAVRAGIRNNNDLVWIGRAPNIAAKLSNLREAPYNTIITDSVYRKLTTEAKMGGNPEQNMWEQCSWEGQVVYRSNWYWIPK